jgi:putative ABC transport system permease protein
MMQGIISVLLRLYPARFRRRMGGDLLETFEEQWRERGDWRLGARTMANLASGAAFERWNGKGDGQMAALIQDIRFAARMLRRSPGFTAIAVAVLALGIGASSAIFSLLDAVIFKPLPFGDPQRLVMLWERSPTVAHHRITPLNFVDWSQQNRSFGAMAAISGGSRTFIGRDGIAQQIPGQAVTARFFDVLRVRPLLGRTFVASDVKTHVDTVVLSERFWRNRLNSDPNAVGREILLDAQPFTVIGVVPGNFEILAHAELWTPYFIPNKPEWRQMHFMQAVGRLKPGVTLEQARADMDVIGSNIAASFPNTNKGWGITIEPLREGLVAGDLRTTTLMLSGVVGFVMLMACANVANLLLVRSAARGREIAVRASIGGSRWRIMRLLLTESVLLGVLGGVAGIGLAALILRIAPGLLPPDFLPVWLKLQLDGRVAGFAAFSALLTSSLFGLAPAWQAARTPLASVLRSGGRSATESGALRTLLAAGEIAAAVLLVAGSGLLLRSLASIDRVDRGFRADHVLTMYVSLPNSRYPNPQNALTFYKAVERETAAVPGVRSVGLSTILPTDGWDVGMGFQVIGQPAVDPSHQAAAHYQMASTDYFRTLGIPLLRGRAFDNGDTAAATPVCIVNEEFARRYFPKGNALGGMIAVQAMAPEGPKKVLRRIVGVSHQVKVEGLAERENNLEIYVPQAQNPWFWAAIAVRTEGDPRALAGAVEAAIARADKQEAVTRVRTMDQVVSDTISTPRFRAGLTGAFAAIALTLAAVGIFGVLAFSVSQRTREFGIRMALGAQSRDVLGMVLREALKIAAFGVTAGLIAAAVLTRSLTSLLFGVTPFDVLTFGGSAALLGLVALLACLTPAWRAAKVDPAVTLHQE